MTISREKCLEMAMEAGIEFHSHIGITGKENISTAGSQSIEKIEALINRAYTEGQKDMRERAAKCVEDSDDQLMNEFHTERIRNLEIE